LLRAKVGVITEATLQFVNGFGGDAGGEDLVEAFEGPMIPLEACDAFFDEEARLLRLFHRTNPAEGGQVPVRLISVHGKFDDNLPRCHASTTELFCEEKETEPKQ